MSRMHIAHLVLLGLWGGVVLAESVVEFSARSDEDHRHAARLHYWIDLLVELPILAGILLTGSVLAWRIWPLDTAMLVKVGSALVAIGANSYCAVLVVLRQRAHADAGAVARLAVQIRRLWLAVPFGAVALYLGLTRFGW